jgi:uncharacterized membrane protein YtjA (UPF0391 family)
MPSELAEPRHRSCPSAGSLGKSVLRARRAADPLEHKQRERVGGPVNPGSAKRNLMLGWAIAFFIVALIAGGLGFGIVSGTAFAAAKIIFVLALLAFLISAVVEVARRGAP